MFLNYQIKASSQQNTAHRKWKSFLICQLIGRLNGESIFRLSSNICTYLKHQERQVKRQVKHAWDRGYKNYGCIKVLPPMKHINWCSRYHLKKLAYLISRDQKEFHCKADLLLPSLPPSPPKNCTSAKLSSLVHISWAAVSAQKEWSCSLTSDTSLAGFWKDPD